jgi:hypothetical protein
MDKYVGTIQLTVHHIVFSSLSHANATKYFRPDENARINKKGSVEIRCAGIDVIPANCRKCVFSS